MAITRSQQARQMLKTAGAVEQDGVLNYIKNSESVTVPKEFKARKNAPATKLAYITAAEAKMLKKKKPGTPHKGPKGIPSYDSFDAEGNFTSGAAMSAAETGDRSDTGRRDVRAEFGPKGLAPGVTPNEVRDLRSAAIAAGAGQRVNPGFFDSRNVISPEELARARAFSRDPNNLFARQAMRRTRGGGLGSFIRGGGFFGNIIRSLGQRFGLGKRFDQPTYDMSQFNNLGLFGQVPEDFEDDPKISNISFTANDPNNILNQNMIIPRSKPDTKGLLEVPGIELTPFQKDIKQDDFEESLPRDVLDNLIAEVTQKDIDASKARGFGKLDRDTAVSLGLISPNVTDYEFEQLKQGNITEPGIYTAADGGMIGGGIMDAAGRQNYFLGKLVKKATRAVKKIVKSPVGKIGLGALALGALPGGFTASGFLRSKVLPALYAKGKLTGLGKLAIGAGISSLPLLFGKQEDEEQDLSSMGSVGGEIDPRAYTDPFGVLYGAFKAEGGSMKDEPVAKRTMPLLDMGGQEMDLRAEGGFVPIGRMEKADDVPARLSKNEFVFTADAVRNAGDGDVDKGAEVMYNMMKNLEAGGDVSEESQGLEGARNMFQTAKRLEDVV
jgi:hypothetical protein